MALSKEDVLNAIAEMSVMEVVDLISDMEEKFGVSAAAAVAAAPAAGAAGGDSPDCFRPCGCCLASPPFERCPLSDSRSSSFRSSSLIWSVIVGRYSTCVDARLRPRCVTDIVRVTRD